MTKFSLAPGFVVVEYITNGHNHKMTLPVQPASTFDPGDTPVLLDKASQNVTLSAMSTALAAVLKPLMVAADTYVGASYWQKPGIDDDPLYINGTTSGQGAGTNGGVDVPYGEAIFTYRTQLGHIFKMYLLETTIAANLRYAGPVFNSIQTLIDLYNYVNGTTSVICGRDGAHLSMSLFLTSKINDQLRKKYIF